MPHWKRNLIVLCFVQLATMIGFSGFQPFVAYFMIENLGVPNPNAAASWVAIFNSGNAVAMMIAAPIWGTVADRYGRRPMVIRATAAGCLFTMLMGFATSPQHLIVLRIIQGIFSGTVGAAVTLVATETPESELGHSLGIMQTAQFIGQTVGPLLGGYAADAFGYRNVFFMSASLMLVSLLLTISMVKETKHVRREAVARQPGRPRLSLAAVGNRNTMLLIMTLAGNSFAIAVLSPVLSLYIRQLIGDVPNLASLAGTVMSVAAFSSSISAVLLGRVADRIGQKKVLVACVMGVALIHIPQSMVTHPNQLTVLRAIQGIFMGGIMPSANALLARSVSQANRGTVFGFSQSAQAAGRAVGPALGAGVSAMWGMSSAFLVTASVFGIMSALVATFVKMPDKAVQPERVETAPA